MDAKAYRAMIGAILDAGGYRVNSYPKPLGLRFRLTADYSDSIFVITSLYFCDLHRLLYTIFLVVFLNGFSVTECSMCTRLGPLVF